MSGQRWSTPLQKKACGGRVILLGKQDNPYPYMKHANLYLSVSFCEAAPVVYAEANFFGVPVLSTDTCSARELLGAGNFICANTEDALRSAFADLITHRDKITQAKATLAYPPSQNNSAIEKFNQWLK